MRAALLVSAVLLLAALVVVVVSASAPPLSRTCDERIDTELCSSTVDAALERGLAPLHPLILSTHVAPGPAAGATQYGHRATVSFALLGIPGTTEVRMITDIGGHWGGAVERGAGELAMWTLLPLLVAGLIAAGLVGLAWRRRATTTG